MKKNIYVITLITLIVDQFIKYIITANIALNSIVEVIPKVFYFTNTRNTGAAWSMFSNSTWILTIISVVVFIFLNNYIGKEKKFTKMSIIYYGLLLGGILGNLVDRLVNSYVIDYIGIKIFNYNFPIFNIADSCIVIGIILLAIEVIKEEINGHNSKRKQ